MLQESRGIPSTRHGRHGGVLLESSDAWRREEDVAMQVCVAEQKEAITAKTCVCMAARLGR